MNRQSFAWLAVAAAALLGGCDSEAPRSVDWYVEHPAERDAKLKECSEQKRLRSDTSDNCARAKKASVTDRPSGQRL